MSAMNSKTTIVLVVIGTVLGTIATYISLRQRRLEKEFETAGIGTTATQLTIRLGNPWRATSCGKVFGGNEPEGCASELVYASPMAPAIPEYWAFRYDHNEKLIDKYHYVSP